MSIAEAEINVLFEGPSLQPYCMLITITLNDAHSACVAMYLSSVSTSTLNCVVFFLFHRQSSLKYVHHLSGLY